MGGGRRNDNKIVLFSVIIGLVLAANLAVFLWRSHGAGRPSAGPVRSAATDVRQADDRRAAIRGRIAQLLTPRRLGQGSRIGQADSARVFQAALLHARLALMEEDLNQTRAAQAEMATAVRLLEEIQHPDPTEAYLRIALARQDAAPRVAPSLEPTASPMMRSAPTPR